MYSCRDTLINFWDFSFRRAICLDIIKVYKMILRTLFCFSDMRSVANHLCQEFMSDIIRVTGSSDDEDTAPLQNYLLRERGWLLLYTIHKNGTQVEHWIICNFILYFFFVRLDFYSFCTYCCCSFLL